MNLPSIERLSHGETAQNVHTLLLVEQIVLMEALNSILLTDSHLW